VMAYESPTPEPLTTEPDSHAVERQGEPDSSLSQ